MPHVLRPGRIRALLLLLAGAGVVQCSDNSSIGPGPVIAVRVVPDSLTLDLGQSTIVRAFAFDADSAFLPKKHPRYASLDGSIASVDDSGMVTGLVLGSTVVTATVEGISGTMKVVVSDPEVAFEFDTVDFAAAELGPDPAPQSLSVTTARLTELNGLAVGGIVYGAGATGWLQASLDQNTTPATITLTPTTGTLPEGLYTAGVTLTATNAAGPATLTVRFVVGTGPSIGLSAGQVDLLGVPGGTDPPPATVQVTNIGGGTLSGLAVGTIVYGPGASGWIASATLDQTTAPATLTIQGAIAGLVGGTYTATVPITGNAVNAPQDVTVSYLVTNQAAIQLSATSSTMAAVHLGADPAPVVINVTNGAGGTLTGLGVSVAYGPGATGWLTPLLSATDAPADLTLTAASGALAAGSYTATVSVTSAVAINTPQNVAVTLNVVTSFTNDIQPILAGCNNGCHTNGPGFDLPEPWPYNQLVGALGCNNGTNSDTLNIVPGDLNRSYIYRLLEGTTQCNFLGYTQMPPTPLPQATRDIVRDWILSGAPNN